MSRRGVVQGRTAVCVAAVLAVVLLSVSATAAGAAGRRVVTVYSVATGLQYINTADDRARGKVNNPLDSAANKLTPRSAGKNGPFAGDVAVYALKLYADSSVSQQTGTAVYTCYFNYDRHALCQAYYKLPGGSTIVASGPIDFNSSKFTIVVSGGTNGYLGARGQANVVPAAHGAQRIDFQLLK
jgi:hypothetical protein